MSENPPTNWKTRDPGTGRGPEVEDRQCHLPNARCVACDRPLDQQADAEEGQFRIPLRERIIVIRCRLCATCLRDPVLRQEDGLRGWAGFILERLCCWYVTELRTCST